MTSPSPDNPIPHRNRWRGRLIGYNKRVMKAADWAKEFGLNPSTFHARYNSGWSMTRIKDTPTMSMGPQALRKERQDCVPRITECKHPVVTAIYKEMKSQQCTYAMLADRAGVGYTTIQAMRYHGPGYFTLVEACANVLGLDIIVVKRRDR